MRFLCDKCNGSGWIRLEDGNLDVCDKCWGLGYIDATSENNPEIQQKIKLSRNSIISMLAGMAIYYTAVFFIMRYFRLSLVYAFFMIFFGYYAGIISNSIYLHFHDRRGKNPGHTKSS